ncbi:MAG: hypothetical protein BWY76_02303 [bacterium ADurb.Bin429]|nr:MAG: hypothetical protein BWY76_02303 [bacterium ADurb.Bin429]
MRHLPFHAVMLCGLLLLALSAPAQNPDEWRNFHTLYVDAVWTRLTGYSSVQQYTTGVRKGQYGAYLALQNAWADTRGSDAIYQYTTQGVTLTGGLRYWFPGDQWFAFTSFGHVIAGKNEGTDDFRVGAAGFNEWEHGKNRVFDLYGDITWVGAADDLYMTIRAREGVILRQQGNTRWWVYGVGHLAASASGDNGASNRLEAGVGLGYRTYAAPFGLSVGLEMREAYSFRGAIDDRLFYNPTIVVAGGF